LLSFFTVTNTNDAGPGSLRQAIIDSNATDPSTSGGTSDIVFAIPAAAGPFFDVPGPGFDPGSQTWTITLQSPLPTLTSPVTIDGLSQGQVPIPFRYPSEAGLAIQTLSVLGNPTGGTFELTGVPSNPFANTVPIAWDATAAEVQAAIQALVLQPGGTVAVTGGPLPSEPMTIVFGGSFSRQIIGPLGSTNNFLTGGVNPGVNATSVSLGGIVSNPTLIVSTPNTTAATLGNDAHDLLVIDGSQISRTAFPDPTGFVIDTSHSTLRGLIIDGFGVGISVPNPTDVGNLIQGNYVGRYPVYLVDPITGSALFPPNNVALNGHGNEQEGIVLGSNNTRVGGANPQENNVISGNGLQGVLITEAATGNVVEGNQIGLISTSIQRYFQVGNGAEGVLDLGSSNQIGGPIPDAGNLISANGSHGVRISGATANRTIVAANVIGLGPGGGYLFGTGNPGNGDLGDGVLIEDSSLNQIGGPTSEWANTISSNFGAGIYITGATAVGNTIENNRIGVTVDGLAAKGNAEDGVADFSPLTVIGPGNQISGNLRGVHISGPSAVGALVRDNLIGTDITGILDLGNAGAGVLIEDATDAVIEGNGFGSQVISGNLIGVRITGASSARNLIAGNLIGSDKSGINPLPNSQEGVLIESSAGNTIGGSTAAARNLISANDIGVRITGSLASSNVVQGNLIGTDITGAAPLPNETDGVIVEVGASGNLIGGPSPADGNIIAFNPGAGVLVSTGIFNSILTNSIFSNGGEGIELIDGGNHNQPAPVLTSIQAVVSGTTITGTVQGTPSTPYTIQFFSNPVSGPEGKTFLGQISVTTDGSGFAAFAANLTVSLNPTQPFITATATSAAGDTSEFSTTGTVIPLTVEFSMASYTVSQAAGTATITVVRSSAGQAGTVAFATSDGTAKAGVDYVTAAGVLSFAAGETEKTFTVSIINTQQVGGSRFLNLTLSNPTGGMTLGTPSMATLTILGFTTPGPIVTDLQLVPNVHGGVIAVVLTFSEPLDPTRAVNLLNYDYSLQAAGNDRRFGTADDLLFGIASATYSPAADSVTLHLATPIRCNSPIRLTINLLTDNTAVPIGVADTSGNLLDGNFDGKPGGVFVAIFTRKQGVISVSSRSKPVSLRHSGSGTILPVRRAGGPSRQRGDSAVPANSPNGPSLRKAPLVSAPTLARTQSLRQHPLLSRAQRRP
jgi:hypothetical protein